MSGDMQKQMEMEEMMRGFSGKKSPFTGKKNKRKRKVKDFG